MRKEKTIGVRRDMVQAYRQVEDEVLCHTKYMYEVIRLATLVNPMTLTCVLVQTRPPTP